MSFLSVCNNFVTSKFYLCRAKFLYYGFIYSHYPRASRGYGYCCGSFE